MSFAVAGRTIAITGAAERLAHELGGTRVAWGTSVDVCSLESVEQAV
jgi:hypothetical protein